MSIKLTEWLIKKTIEKFTYFLEEMNSVNCPSRTF